MFKLTNEQRRCFALAPVDKKWICIEAKKGPYDNYKTLLYIDGDIIVKCILTGEEQYSEYELNEKISEDRKYLLPKTSKGKPVLLTASSVQKRNGIGMRLNYYKENIHLYNEKTECAYYTNAYLNEDICNLNKFAQWVERWCEETTQEDINDIIQFSQRTRKHIRYKEGDVFRFKIGRRLYGYGRVLLNYGQMRKEKEPFWDILMCKPLVCSVYHIVTERTDVGVNELKHLLSLPSKIMADNALYYGEYEIIGNLPVTDNEDFPIMYGQSIDIRENAVCYQCGKTFRKIDNDTALYKDFINNGVSFRFNFILDILLKCIDKKSNAPYWKLYHPRLLHRDLRNPKYKKELKKIKKQMNV